jgi:hypothetical protein
MRDGARCVLCGDVEGISAHHICRKSFMVVAEFETGNGISLCRSCHREVHFGFNGRPDLTLPMDAQGGEKIDTMEDLYGRLLDDAGRQGLLCDEFYFLSDITLEKFKMFQGFEPDTLFEGCRLQQAYWIWRQCPRNAAAAILDANGCEMTPGPFGPGVTLTEGPNGELAVCLVGSGWLPASK